MLMTADAHMALNFGDDGYDDDSRRILHLQCCDRGIYSGRVNSFVVGIGSASARSILSCNIYLRYKTNWQKMIALPSLLHTTFSFLNP
jgi:hypothetical protein